ncbi:MAG: hypothetical protein NT116_06430, partial [Candidatus Parcubacteria bacterium]|nr:hypothetical protein [Candidatus Parcubacteria bacterium]
MDVEDYKIKYLKYKQKYTNALQNMQGGGDAEVSAALETQPKAVYVLKKETYDKLKLSFDISENTVTSVEVLPSQFNEESVKLAISMLDKNSIRILPMIPFKKESSATKFGIIKIGKDKLEFKGGLEKVDGTTLPFSNESPVGGMNNFGQNNKNRYDGTEALKHLKNGKISFNNT